MHFKRNSVCVVGVSLFFILMAEVSQAYLSVQESGEIGQVGNYRLGLEPQAKLSSGGGANLTGFFDAPLNEESSFRGLVGFGDRDFYVGGSFKWIPIPDYENQPAIGGKFSVITSREASVNFVSFRLDPIVSKKFQTDQGLFIPYAAIPVTVTNGDSKTITGIQVVGGTEYVKPEWDATFLGAELGIDAKDSFSYLSVYVSFYLDDIKRIGQ